MKAKTSKLFKKVVKRSLVDEPSAVAQTERDFKDAILTVSVFANLFLLCIWVTLQVTAQYDNVLFNFFVNR